VSTQFRWAVAAAIALGAVWAGQALAFWPFGNETRVDLAPAYGGVCEDCDLSGRILTGARMTNSNFSRSDFSNAVLAHADGTGSRFEGANFTDADLAGARFVRASLLRARFRGARLDRADLSGADLRQARGLTQAQLDQACGDGRTRLPRGMRVERCDW
jgi:uncharacterized protein YjbI with pentapeptide repeats